MASKVTLQKSGLIKLQEYSKIGTLAHLLIESSDDAIKSKTLDGVIASWNHGAEKIYGYTQEEIVGKNVSILVPPNQPNEMVDLLKKISKGNHIPHYETKRIRKDGVVIDVSLALSPIKDQKGTIIGVATVSRDITGRTQASQYARSLIEASLDPLVTISTGGKITDVNEATIKVTGLTREKLIGTDFSNYFTEPDNARDGYQQVFKKGFVKDYPLTLKSRQGKLTDVLYNATVYKDDAGNVLGVFAAARDITETKQASRYARNLIEASLDPLVTISLEGKITDVNEASVKVTGVPRRKLIGTDFSDYFTEPEKAREGYKKVFEVGSVSDYPLTIRHNNGDLTDVLYNATIYKDPEGKVLGVFAAARDVTEAKLADEKLKKIQLYTRTLIETSIDPLITKGPDGKISDVNKATETVTGLSREQLIGTHFPNYFTEPPKAEEAYQRAFEKGAVYNFPLTIKHTSGKTTDVLYNAAVYKDENGNIQGVFASARDITEQKQASQYTRSLIEASLDPLVTISPEGKITDVNEALVNVTGVPREKLIGTDFSNYFTDPLKASEGYQQVLKLGFVKDYSLTIKSKDEKLTDVLYNATVYKDTNGNVLGVFAAARDVTTQKILAEREVAEREKEMQRIAELEKFQKLTVGRELKMIELKKEIEELRKKLGLQS